MGIINLMNKFYNIVFLAVSANQTILNALSKAQSHQKT